MADLSVRVYGRGSPPIPLSVGPPQTLQATPVEETVHAATGTPLVSLDEGIAAEYPGDIGIASDPDVLFVEMFQEASTTELAANWTDSALTTSTFSSDVPDGSPGLQSLLLQQNRVTPPLSEAKLFKNLGGQGSQPLYVRCYFKYPSAAVRADHGGLWVGGNAPELGYHFVPSGTRPPTTDTAENDNYFSAAAEVVDATGRIDHYDYWPYMHADGNGDYWGNFLLNDPSVVITYGEWFCLEVMVKLNSSTSAADGEHAIWLNGVKISHLGLGFPNGTWSGNRFTQDEGGTPFEGFQWTPSVMTFDTLDLNWIFLHCYNGSVDASMYVDHLVVARRYIGPMVPVAGFYVSTTGNDANPGTFEEPWLTLEKGVTSIASGDILWIRGGSYTRPTSNPPAGASWATATQVRAYGNESVTVANWAALNTASQAYIVFEGIIFDGTSTGFSEVVYVDGAANHIRFQNCTFTGGWGSGSGGAGLALYGTGGFHEVIDCTVSGNGFLPTPDHIRNHGIYIKSGNNLIQGCHIYGNAAAGVHFFNGVDPIDGGNVVERCNIHGNNSGIFLWSLENGVTVRNNLIYDNNIEIGGPGISISGGTLAADIYNNTAVNNVYGIDITGGTTSMIITNNIFWANIDNYALNSGSVTADYNISGDGQGIGAHGSSSNPLFANEAGHNYHLQSLSPARDAGQTIASVTEDYDQVTRPQGSAYCIGAFEYV